MIVSVSLFFNVKIQELLKKLRNKMKTSAYVMLQV
jgi:hypothetical protein